MGTLSEWRGSAVAVLGVCTLVMIGCSSGSTPGPDGDENLAPSAHHAVRAAKLRTLMDDLDAVRTQQVPKEPGARAAQADRIRGAAEALAYTAADIPSVLVEVNLPPEEESAFYAMAERLNAAALELRDVAGSGDSREMEAAFADVVSSCDACHSRFRVLPAAHSDP